MSATTTAGAASSLAPTGLTGDQLLHFAEHGWVLLPGVISDDLCRRCIDAIDGIHARYTLKPSDLTGDDLNAAWGYREPQTLDPVFYDTYTIPGLYEALIQLTGNPRTKYLNSLATLHRPHPARLTERERFLDPHRWGWHRDYRPKDILVSHDTDPNLINSLTVNAAMYFVPVSPDDGVTAFLDGSIHHHGPDLDDADVYAALGEQYLTVRPTAPAGSIVLFSEASYHAASPILSEQTRYATFNWMGAPWHTRVECPPIWTDYLADERLRSLFRRGNN